MTFAGVLIACWLVIAAMAFLAISRLGKLAGHGDVDAELGIVDEVELRVLLGGRHEHDARKALYTRFARALDTSGSMQLGGETT